MLTRARKKGVSNYGVTVGAHGHCSFPPAGRILASWLLQIVRKTPGYHSKMAVSILTRPRRKSEVTKKCTLLALQKKGKNLERYTVAHKNSRGVARLEEYPVAELVRRHDQFLGLIH